MTLPICGECTRVAAVRIITRCDGELRSIMRCDEHVESYFETATEPDGVAIDLTVYEVHRIGRPLAGAASP